MNYNLIFICDFMQLMSCVSSIRLLITLGFRSCQNCVVNTLIVDCFLYFSKGCKYCNKCKTQLLVLAIVVQKNVMYHLHNNIFEI
jgi:hypothetical protein